MSYKIPDEPEASRWNKYVVRPSGPLLAAMLCGAWLSWPWFAFNGYAMGSPTRRKELALCFAAIAGTALMAMGVLALLDSGVIVSTTALRIAALVIAAFKMGMSYYLSIVQGRTFGVYEYYGGQVRSAMAVIIVGTYLRTVIIGLVDDPIWRIIVSGGV
jgi:hypothetical protein